MTMKKKMLRGFIAGLVGLTAALATVNGGGQPGSAATCQRSVAIDPQVTVSEQGRTLTFEVHTNSCAQAGSVSFMVADGTAHRPGDYDLEGGTLTWQMGDVSSRFITATIVDDLIREPLVLKNFMVTLAATSQNVRVASAKGEGRIFENDGVGRLATVDDGICLIADGIHCKPKPSPVGGHMRNFGPIGTQTIEPGHVLIALNEPNLANQMIHVQTADGGLTAGTDYTPINHDFLVQAGDTSVTVEFGLMQHAFTLPGQSFTVTISAYTAGGVVESSSTYTMVA